MAPEQRANGQHPHFQGLRPYLISSSITVAIHTCIRLSSCIAQALCCVLVPHILCSQAEVYSKLQAVLSYSQECYSTANFKGCVMQ